MWRSQSRLDRDHPIVAQGVCAWKLQEMQARAGPDTGPHSAISGSNASVSPQDDDAAHAGDDAPELK